MRFPDTGISGHKEGNRLCLWAEPIPFFMSIDSGPILCYHKNTPLQGGVISCWKCVSNFHV